MDGSHKCVKSGTKCSPDFCNFKGTCELQPNKQNKNVPTCVCQDLYDGKTCNLCKDKTMQFPGCHTPRLKALQKENIDKIESLSQQECINGIPPTLDTYEDLKFNGESKLSGIFSLSEINQKIKLSLDGSTKTKFNDCLQGLKPSTIKIYLEFLEETYINKRIPISLVKVAKNNTEVVKQSEAVYLPGLGDNSPFLRGEYLEAEIKRETTPESDFNLHVISFDIADAMNSGVRQISNGWLEVYIELAIIPQDRLVSTDSQCNLNHDSPPSGYFFSNSDSSVVLPSTYDFSSVLDPTKSGFTMSSNWETQENCIKELGGVYAYKEGDGQFFAKKEIEAIENQVQHFKLLQNFGTSGHLLALVLEIPLDSNTTSFAHTLSAPDCISNECIYSDKVFDASEIDYYTYNPKNTHKIRLWVYRLTSSKSSALCTPYHLSIKTTPAYLDDKGSEKVACKDEIFPTQITTRRWQHIEIKGVYIINDNFRIDSFMPNSEGSVAKSTINIEKPSLLKVIIEKEMGFNAFEVSIFQSGVPTDLLLYSTNNLFKKSAELKSNDIRISILLPAGRYSLRIRAVMQESTSFSYKTCDSVRLFVGLLPTDSLKDPDSNSKPSDLTDLSTLMQGNGTKVKLISRKAENQKDGNKFVTDYEEVQRSEIRYMGGDGKLGFYYEIIENNDPTMHVEISEISSGLFPEIEVKEDKEKSKKVEMPVVATSSGKTYVYIPQLSAERTYILKILKHKLLTVSDTVKPDVFSAVLHSAYLYSADKSTELKKAKIEINGKMVTLPVKPWMPACSETPLTNSLLTDIILDVISTGIPYVELLVLNENIDRVGTPLISLKEMMDLEGTLSISASPYDTDSESILEEFMVTGTAKGSEKYSVRSQQFDGDIYLAEMSLNKNKHDTIAIKLNYAFNTDTTTQSIFSKCNTIRMSVQFTPKTIPIMPPL